MHADHRANQSASQPARDSGLIGEGLAEARARLTAFAETDQPVLLLGETGTGKELAAVMLHELSRRGAPFIPLNCAAVTDALFESELFGHVRGAFTGAIAAQGGLIAAAKNGTLFLDEIGEMPLTMQPKLLRALETRRARPVGGAEEEPFSARFVSATRVDLRAAVKQGRFRDDLYHRLSVFPVRMPPLRERRGDIRAIVQHLVNQLSTPMVLSEDAFVWLESREWPGNVRELRNLLVRGNVLGRRLAIVTASDLERMQDGDHFTELERDVPLEKLKDAERAFHLSKVKNAVARYGTISKAATELGVSRKWIRGILRAEG